MVPDVWGIVLVAGVLSGVDCLSCSRRGEEWRPDEAVRISWFLHAGVARVVG